MTSRELLAMLLRRWYIVVAGMLLTIAVVWPVSHRPGVYWTQMSVLLLPPTYEYFPNKLEDPHYSLSALAGLVVDDFNGQNRPLMTASSDTTLYGMGLRSGLEVKQPNMGNQWQPLFPNAAIDVQVVDRDPEVVAARARETVGELDQLLAQRQDELGVIETMRVSLIASPDEASVYYISGSRTRAMAVGAAVGIILTVVAVYWVERFTGARGRRRDSVHSGEKRNSKREFADAGAS